MMKSPGSDRSMTHTEKALSAFWHRTRRQFVPLIGSEMEDRHGIGATTRASLCRAGLVKSTTSYEDQIYEITEAGRDLLLTSGWEQ